jgi:hypothetical protein
MWDQTLLCFSSRCQTVGRYRHLLFVSGLLNKRRNGLAIHGSFGETGSSLSFYSSNMLSILEHPSNIYDPGPCNQVTLHT